MPCARLLQVCPTPCHSVDSSLPDSSIRGILQARVLEWVALLQGIVLTQGSNPHLAGRFFTVEPPGKPRVLLTPI